MTIESLAPVGDVCRNTQSAEQEWLDDGIEPATCLPDIFVMFAAKLRSRRGVPTVRIVWRPNQLMSLTGSTIMSLRSSSGKLVSETIPSGDIVPSAKESLR